jgi:uncharacterized membrane protein YeiH
MEIIVVIMEIMGIISFAAAGAMVAIEKETDAFGVVFLSLITCFGGGIIRDILVGAAIGRDVPWVFSGSFDANLYLIIGAITSVTVFLVATMYKRAFVRDEKRVIAVNNVLDAVGIGVFAAMGTDACLSLGPFVAITMGMVSSVFGGLSRDIILRDIPFVLRKYIYALATIIGSAVYYLICAVLMPGSEFGHALAILCCTITVFSIRILATHYKWNLPKAIDYKKLKQEEVSGFEAENLEETIK